MRVLFIVNSVASSVTARRRVVIHKALSTDHDVTLAETSRRGHATRLAQSAARDGYDLVVVLGGDGTLNEAANGLAGTDTALATLPGGSTNVFARILGLPDDSVDAIGVLLEAIDAGSIRRIGLGAVEGRYFLFHCGVGFDAAVVEQVERRGPWKRWAGHPLFVWAALDTWFRRVNRKDPPLRIVGTDGQECTTGFFTIVMNANPYTFLGSRAFDLVKDLTLEDPLAVVTLEHLDLRTLGPVASRALTSRDLSPKSGLDIQRNVRSIVIEADPPAPYQVDGDHLGSSKRLRFTWTPEHLSLVVPVDEA
ncbi:MAG: diacylglycerol kinase family lipid kinase [Acidimicrobiaceae bacterium]|nr:diacylglycerol kinase family lipid kinase [Acidimicrobiaceae bacterium]MBT5851589.1 diacylglycerol kinase family lipid kinase [Acidimicrobiaceae bacterium]